MTNPTDAVPQEPAADPYDAEEVIRNLFIPTREVQVNEQRWLVRGLSRDEAVRLRGKGDSQELSEIEVRALIAGCVRPKFTESQARRLHKLAPAGMLQEVVQAILNESGMVAKDADGGAKSDEA